ncbi:hypothetical protein Hjap01_04078 [Haloarcula japonica]
MLRSAWLCVSIRIDNKDCVKLGTVLLGPFERVCRCAVRVSTAVGRNHNCNVRNRGKRSSHYFKPLTTME